MNILTGIHFGGSNKTVTLFYTYFRHYGDPEIIRDSPDLGIKKCEMFTVSTARKWNMFPRGITFKYFTESQVIQGVEKKGVQTFKAYFHPDQERDQIYQLADLADFCSLSGLSVIEYFSKLKSGINQPQKKAG